ncbi:hypothetical protein DdX_16287 [Ditylenchus destructor]|uniref:Mos1 transposase HTH domain-containing protein n=1 Tax=Ditylenchus destructor TaxID=166010 RepID=A0AAD4MTE2_9BILA|nr:hypothetical protein DdX_16287 [Ditylenchus destructor]
MPPKRKRDTTPDDLESEPDDLEAEPDDLEAEPDAMEPLPDAGETVPDSVEKLPDAVVSAMTAKQFHKRNLREQLAIRYQMLAVFEAGDGPSKAEKSINALFGKGTTTQASCSHWFKRFRSGDKNLVSGNTRIWSQSEVDASDVFRKLECEAQGLREQVLKAYAAKNENAARKKAENAPKRKRK